MVCPNCEEANLEEKYQWFENKREKGYVPYLKCPNCSSEFEIDEFDSETVCKEPKHKTILDNHLDKVLGL